MARERRHDQHHRLLLELIERARIVGETLETAQFAERFVNFDAFVDGHLHTVDFDSSNAKNGFFVVFAQAVHQVVASRCALSPRHLPQRRQWVAVELGCYSGQVGERFHEGALGFVDLVQHSTPFLSDLLHCNIPARFRRDLGTYT